MNNTNDPNVGPFQKWCDTKGINGLFGGTDNVRLAYIEWHRIRRMALMVARRAASGGQGIQVSYGVEANSLYFVSAKGFNDIIHNTVQWIKPEVMLYSSYESLHNGTLGGDVNVINSVLASNGMAGTPLVIGELGFAEAAPASRQSLASALKTLSQYDGVHLSYVWNAFNFKQCQAGDSACFGLFNFDGTPYLADTTAAMVPQVNTNGATRVTNSQGTFVQIWGQFPSSPGLSGNPEVIFWCPKAGNYDIVTAPATPSPSYYSSSSQINVLVPSRDANPLISCLVRVVNNYGWSTNYVGY